MQSSTATRSQPDFAEAAEAAFRRALTVGVVSAVVVGVLLGVALWSAVSPLLGLLAVLVVAGGGSLAWTMAVRSSFSGAGESLAASLGRPVGRDELVSLRNALEGVAILTGVQVPELRLLHGPAANAMVIGGPAGSTVVVSAGLPAACATVIESEAIAASLLCRVRDGSAYLGTLVAALPAVIGRAAGLDESGLAQLLGDQRAVQTDSETVAVTRYPPGLIEALEHMQTAGTGVDGAPAATASMWIAPAVDATRGVHEALDRTVNQTLRYRAAVLREL